MEHVPMPDITPIAALLDTGGAARACNEIHVCQQVPQGYTGPLAGCYNPDTGFHYAWLPAEESEPVIAWVGTPAEQLPLCGWWEKDELRFAELCQDGTRRKLEVHRFTTELAFSRNGTLVDQEALNRKTVDIIGCGSVGYHMAMTLCRAGVTHFNLLDRDRVEIHNLTRCYGRTDLGSYKTQALARALLNINPACEINTYECFIQDVNDPAFLSRGNGNRLLLSCADSRIADSECNRLCQIYGWDMLSVGFWSGACIDEFFIYRHEKQDHAYGCVFREAVKHDAQVEHFANYTSSNQPEQKVMPGLCASILSAISIATQLALDLLLEGERNYISKLLPYMSSQYMLYCNCNVKELAGDIAALFPKPLAYVCPRLTPADGCQCNDGQRQ